jgi:hypothetical protein
MLLADDDRLPRDAFSQESDAERIATDALRALDDLGFVGVLELGDVLWPGLSELFGVVLEPVSAHVTGEESRPVELPAGDRVVTRETLTRIEQRTRADAILYEHALESAGVDAADRRLISDLAFVEEVAHVQSLIGPRARRAAWPRSWLEAITGRRRVRAR